MVTRFLDLLFYKLYYAYKKKDSAPVFSSILFLGLIRFSILLFIGVSINLLADGIVSTENPNFKKIYLVLGLVIIELPILIGTFKRYGRKEKIKELELKYSEKKYHKVKSWYVFMLPVLFIILMLIMVFTFGNVVFMPGNN